MLLRVGIGLSILTLLYLSQRFWYRALWRVTANWGRTPLRVGVRVMYLVGIVLIILSISDNLRQDHGRLIPNHSPVAAFTGVWFLGALLGYLLIKGVHGI